MESTNTILRTENLHIGYTAKKKSISVVNNIDFKLQKGTFVSLLGKNGIGKSTFLDILSGKTKPDTGEAIPGVTTKYGYFTQESIDLNPEHRVIEEVKEIAEFITLADGTQLSDG